MQISFSIDQKTQDLEPFEVLFLFPYVLRFFSKMKRGCDIDNGRIFAQGNDLAMFCSLLESAMRDILEDCYSEPDVRHRQAHSGYYGKFTYDGKKYVVNYTTSSVGRLIYCLYQRHVLLKAALEQKRTVEIIASFQELREAGLGGRSVQDNR